MNSRRYIFGLLAQRIVGSFALLALAGAGVAEEKTPIVVVEAKSPADCKNLGKVTGTSQANPVNESRARKEALARLPAPEPGNSKRQEMQAGRRSLLLRARGDEAWDEAASTRDA